MRGGKPSDLVSHDRVPLEVDSSIETYMTSEGHYENNPCRWEIYRENEFVFHMNERLEYGLTEIYWAFHKCLHYIYKVWINMYYTFSQLCFPMRKSLNTCSSIRCHLSIAPIRQRQEHKKLAMIRGVKGKGANKHSNLRLWIVKT